MNTISANLFANVQPAVLNAGGSALDLNGMVLTNSSRIPQGTILSFPTALDVADYFGPSSSEAKIAGGGTNNNGVSIGSGYFGGYTNSTKRPAALLFAPANTVAVGSWLRGGDVSALTLAQLQAITGSISVLVDGSAYANGSLSLSGATSFSNAASIIQTALNSSPPTEAAVTGSIATTTLTVTAVASGTLIPGQTIAGSGLTAGTKIVSQLTSTETSGALGGKGTYTVSASQTFASGAITATQTLAVTYDSVSGGFLIASATTGAFATIAFATGTAAAPLKLTSATGAVISQGAAPADFSTVMSGVIQKTQNFASFMTSFDPDGGSGNANKQKLANWNNGQNNRYIYACWDTDVTPTESVPATNSLGYLLAQNANSGTVLFWEPSGNGSYNYAPFVMGFVASLDFERTNGRTTFAYRNQAGLTPTVLDNTTFVNLSGNPQSAGDFGNGYNCYAAIATANQQFIDAQRGTITGPFQWLDSYANQIWMNNAFQLALMELLQNTPSIPYNQAGNALIEAALADPINAAGNFGAFRPGVALSAAQISEVNNQAGKDIATVLQNRGWYLQIGVASAQVRQARGTPPMTFWYVDGQSVQAFNLASILVQ